MDVNTHQLIHQLRLQLKLAEQQVLQHDQRLVKQQRRLLKNTERFNQSLFDQTGAALAPCIEQISQKITQLEKLLEAKIQVPIISMSCQGIQDRFTALKGALNTTSLEIKSCQQHRTSIRAKVVKHQDRAHVDSGFDWIAAGVMHNSHQLYNELHKHLDWIKKFDQQLKVLQLKLENCHDDDKIALQNEILTIDRRTGKCRQAISYIEDRIQTFERPNYNHNS